MSLKVCHLTSAHPRYDIRIFVKECRSLALAGFDVSLVVADGKGDEKKERVKIYDVGKSAGRISRMLQTTEKIYRKAMALNADVYHFHDPELMSVAARLLKKHKKVIYDVHEDLPRQLFGKAYLGKFTARVISFFAEKVENYFAQKFSGIIVVTPFIRKRFQRLNKNVEMICNFPILEEFQPPLSKGEGLGVRQNFSISSGEGLGVRQNFSIPFGEGLGVRENLPRSLGEGAAVKQKNICYIGSITEERGIFELLDAMEKINAHLQLAGIFETGELRQRAINHRNWNKVNELGNLDRKDVSELLSRSKVGMSVLRRLPNYVNAYPIKIFEYMAAGIPVVASDFPLWREIVEGNNCGICVTPEDTDAIAAAINKLLNDEQIACSMGENGRKAVKEKYNWEQESQKLILFYNSLQ